MFSSHMVQKALETLTANELLQELAVFGYSRSLDWIDRQRKQGLLKALRPTGPTTRRGRPPSYVYPRYNVTAAIWLARYGKRIRNLETKRLWVWLLGIDAGEGPDPDAMVSDLCVRMWDALKQRVPSLPSIDEALKLKNAGGQPSNTLLDEWEEEITKAESERWGVMLLLLTGLIPPDEIVSMDSEYDPDLLQLLFDLNPPDRSATVGEIGRNPDSRYAAINVQAVKLLFQNIFGICIPHEPLKADGSVLRDPTLAARSNILDLYEATLQKGTLDWNFMRWFFIEMVVPALFIHPEHFPEMEQTFRNFYTRMSPEQVIAGLAMTIPKWSDEEVTEARAAIREIWSSLLQELYQPNPPSQAQKAPPLMP